METTVRYCRRCRASTDHHRESDRPRSALGLVLDWLVSPILNPWRCGLCEMRDAEARSGPSDG